METGMHDPGPLAGGTGGHSTEELKDKATQLTRSAGERAMAVLDQHKSHACDLLDRIAQSVEDDPVGAYAADYARRGAGYLRGRPASELARSIERELRARPGLALSAAFVAGLALARLVKGAGEAGGARIVREVSPGAWTGGEGEARERPYGELKAEYESWRHGGGR